MASAPPPEPDWEARALSPDPAEAAASVPVPPASPVRRDRSLDLLRGLAVTVMVTDHLVGHSWLHLATLGTLYVTAAEGFVFCSGLALGRRCRQRWESQGPRSVLVAAWRRAGLLWASASTLLLLVGALAWAAPGSARPVFDQAPGDLGALAFGALTLQLAPPLLDILPMYVGFLALTPALAWLAARRAWRVALALSAAAWALNWLDPYALASAPLDRNGRTYFPLASWQAIFVASYMAGWHRGELARAWAWVPRAGWAISLGVITLGLALAATHDAQLGSWPMHSPERASWLAATDRSLLGPLRLIAVASFFPLVLALLRLGGNRLARTLGPLLLPLGRNALYVYLLHIPLVLAWTAWVAPHLGSQAWLATLGQLGVVAILWEAVRRRWLFGFIPR